MIFPKFYYFPKNCFHSRFLLFLASEPSWARWKTTPVIFLFCIWTNLDAFSLYNLFIVGPFSKPQEFCSLHPPPPSHWSLPSFVHIFFNRCRSWLWTVWKWKLLQTEEGSTSFSPTPSFPLRKQNNYGHEFSSHTSQVTCWQCRMFDTGRMNRLFWSQFLIMKWG